MKNYIRVFSVLLAAITLIITSSCSLGGKNFAIEPNEFEYQETSVPNPMKGFVSLYETPTEDASLEYVGLRFDEVYNHDGSVGSINTDHIDIILATIAKRGNAAIFRVYIIYPGYNNDSDTGLYLPNEIYDQLNQDGDIYSNQYGGYKLEYPNFNNPKLMEYMIDFITQLGERYDGHPALAAIQLGLYGSWGEWNMSGCQRQRCAMTTENMSKLIKAYTNAFKTTKLMARNPSLGHASEYDVGFHDDNFLFNSSDFHTKSDEWKALLKKIDPSYGKLQQFYDFINGCNGNYEPIWDKWQTQMFGGELSGMMYDDCFGSILEGTEREAMDYSINQFHMTWLMGVGKGGIPEKGTTEYKEYLKLASSFGYEIGINDVETKERTGKIIVSLKNYGIAPFYYDWPLEYSLSDKKGNVVYTYRDVNFKLSELLPETVLQSEFLIPDSINRGEYSIALRVVNPAEEISQNAAPMKLANNNKITDGIYELASVKIN